jgi:5-methylcytosine-specific restriction enzyme subunit McrC
MLGRWKADVERSPTLDALLATFLARLTEQSLRIGLRRDYMPAHRTLRGLKGRIDFTTSLKQLSFYRGEAVCHYHDFSIDCPKNQIVRTTLARLSRLGEFGPNLQEAERLRHRLRRLVRDLDGVRLIELTPDFIHRQQLHRNDGDYRIMLAIAALLLQRQMPTEASGLSHTHHLDRDLLALPAIYERFVANFYQAKLTDWSVARQAHLDWHASITSPFMPIMKPDLVLKHRHSKRLLVIDTKFTAKGLVEGQYGKAVFDSSHLYQMYAYLRSQEHLSPSHQSADGILLYPTVHHGLAETVLLQGHNMRVESVDLADDWPRIERRLLELVAN